MLSEDDGQSWQWVCEEAVQYGLAPPAWWVGQNGRLLGGTFTELFISSDRGCTWTTHPEFADAPDGGQATGVSDLHSSGVALFATSARYGAENGVWRSADEGATWARLPPRSAGEFFTTVRAAPSRPQRVYVAAWWFRPDPTEYLYVSDDHGDTFTRRDISQSMPMVARGTDGGVGLARGSFYVHAVHPTDPDTVWATLQQGEDPRHSFVLESNDQGLTWAVRLDISDQVVQVVLSPDGGTVWAASSGKLYRSTSQPASFVPLDTPASRSCATRYGERFYACGWPEIDGFAVAREAEDGGWSPVLTWPRVNRVASCPASSRVTTQCPGFFPALQARFSSPDGGGGAGGGGNAGGAGGGAGGGSGGTGGGDMPPGWCGCGAGNAEVSLTLLVLVGRLVAGHAHRRRRVHR